MKTLCAIACAFLLAAPSAVAAPAKPYTHDEAAIVKVDCDGGWGTAVKVGPSQYITAAHVTDNGICTVDGVGITIVTVDRWNDYAIFIGPTNNHVIVPSCENFETGKIYVARGFAAGFNANVLVPWMATELTDRGRRLFITEAAIPGMSGGPVIDRRGHVAGIVNMRVGARSLPLARTVLCQ